MRARLTSLLMRPTAPPIAPGVVYLIGLLLVWTAWGSGVALATSVATALAFDYFRSAVERTPLPNRHFRQSRLVARRSLSGSGAGDQHAHGGSA